MRGFRDGRRVLGCGTGGCCGSRICRSAGDLLLPEEPSAMARSRPKQTAEVGRRRRLVSGGQLTQLSTAANSTHSPDMLLAAPTPPEPSPGDRSRQAVLPWRFATRGARAALRGRRGCRRRTAGFGQDPDTCREAAEFPDSPVAQDARDVVVRERRAVDFRLQKAGDYVIRSLRTGTSPWFQQFVHVLPEFPRDVHQRGAVACPRRLLVPARPCRSARSGASRRGQGLRLDRETVADITQR